MGRYYFDAKTTIEQATQLNIFKLKEFGLLNGIFRGSTLTWTLYLVSGGYYFGCRYCYDLSYESRNECRLGRFGNIGFPLVAERQYEGPYNNIKRWTWRGRPTRKVKNYGLLSGK